MKINLALTLTVVAVMSCSGATMIRNATEKLVRSTYKIEGGGSVGTAFVLLEPWTTKSNDYAFLLVTAAHVLEGIATSNATLGTRSFDGTNYTKMPTELVIRTNGVPVWTRHPSADVAVMRIGFRNDADTPSITADILADDDYFRDFQITPADELRVIGYPLSFEALSGFGIVRSAPIASFPLSPAKKFKHTFWIFPFSRATAAARSSLRRAAGN